MLRPNKTEEIRLLELSHWIEQAEAEELYSSYVLKKIKREIELAWEHVSIRKNMCSKDLLKAKRYLVERYTEDGDFYELIKQKIYDIKDELCSDVFDFFVNYSQDYFVTLHLHKIRYENLLMIKSGWLPNLNSFLDVNLEEEAIAIQNKIKVVNQRYNELLTWINSLKLKNKVDDFYKHIYIHDLFNASDENNIIETLKNKILNSQKNSRVNILGSFIIDNELGPIKETYFYPNQKDFYIKLEKWAYTIQNPYCREWIIDYLNRGKSLPFCKIRVFKYIRNIEKAKNFLLEQYEEKLKKIHLKDLKQNKYSKNQYYDDLNSYKRALLDIGAYNFKEKINLNSPREQGRSYFFGYSGTWVHDEMMYNSDDIDTIFDGNPEAYWNID